MARCEHGALRIVRDVEPRRLELGAVHRQRQRLRGHVPAAADGVNSFDGIATVAVVGSKQAGWKVVYASSTLAPTDDTTGSFDAHARRRVDGRRARRRHGRLGPRGEPARARRAGPRPSTSTASLERAVRPEGRVRDAAPRRARRLRDDRRLDRRRRLAERVPGRRRRRDAATVLYRQNALEQHQRQPDLEGLPDRAEDDHDQQVPVELPERRHAPALVLDATSPAASTPPATPASSTRSASPRSCRGTSTTTRPPGADLGTTQTTGNNVDEARLWSGGHGAFGNPALYRAISATRDYQYPFTNAWYTSGCNPANLTRQRERHRRRAREPVRHAQPHARLLVLPRLRRGPLERAAVQQRRHDGRPVAARRAARWRLRSATTA